MTFNPQKCSMYTSKRVLCDKPNEIEGLCKFHYGVQQKRLRRERLDELRDQLIVKLISREIHWTQAEMELKKLDLSKASFEKAMKIIREHVGLSWLS